ncbi:MAG: MerR family transcriptional regulator [Candidatus Hydrogenedentota bacterium]
MLIGELVKNTGLSRDTIRYYETRGLLEEPIRRDNKYKEYTEATIPRLDFIKEMQGLGFTLKETGQFIELFESGNATCQNTGPHLQAHMKRIDEKIDQLVAMRERMQQSFTACEGNSLTDQCSPITIPLSGELRT